jgi:hypothetical protein
MGKLQQLEFAVCNGQGPHARGAGKVYVHAKGHGSRYAVGRAPEGCDSCKDQGDSDCRRSRHGYVAGLPPISHLVTR